MSLIRASPPGLGVGVMIRASLPLEIDEVIYDDRGRYAVIVGRWEVKTILLMSVYVPPGLQ